MRVYVAKRQSQGKAGRQDADGHLKIAVRPVEAGPGLHGEVMQNQLPR